MAITKEGLFAKIYEILCQEGVKLSVNRLPDMIEAITESHNKTSEYLDVQIKFIEAQTEFVQFQLDGMKEQKRAMEEDRDQGLNGMVG